MPIFPLALLFLIGAIVLLWRGLRGVAIDDHPVCRKCDFDLTGKPETSTRCPECGADLMQPKAIRIGHRRRRNGSLAIGSVLAGILIFGLALVAVMNVRQIDPYSLKPTWWLIREADDSTAMPRAAWAELSRRLAAGDLSAGQTSQIAELALAIQANRSRAWDVAYGNFIESARSTNLVSDAQWTRYARNALNLSLVARSEVRKGDDLPLRIMNSNNRVGSNSRFYLTLHDNKAVGDLVDDYNAGGSMGSSVSSGGTGSSGHDVRLNPKAVTTAPTGPRTVSLNPKVEIREGWAEDKPIIAEWTEHLSTTWSLVPADTVTVEIIDDPTQQSAIEKSIKVTSLTYTPGGRDYLNLNIQFIGLPVPVAFDVFARADGQEKKLSSIYVKNSGSSGWGTGGEFKTQAKAADFILRSNINVARRTVDMTRMWKGEVTIKNIPIQRPATNPAAPPATNATK